MPTRGAELLAAWLESTGKSQTEASFDLRISKQLISNYLKGKAPGLPHAIILRDVACIPVDTWRQDPEAEPDTAAPAPSEAPDKAAS